MGIKHDEYTAINNFIEGNSEGICYEAQAVLWLNFIAERTAEMSDNISVLKRQMEKLQSDLKYHL